MVDNSSQDTYKVQFIKFDLNRGYAEYLVKVMAPGNITFHIKDRYSSMRQFQSMMKKQFNLKTYNGFPNFPPKKLLSNTSQEFLTNRMSQLQTFFNNFLSKSEIAKSPALIMYFKEKRADNPSAVKIEELIEYLDRKVNQKKAQGAQGGGQTLNQQIANGIMQQAQRGNTDEGNREQNLIVQSNQNFDWKAFESECRKIVNEISDRFIDLGLDDGQHSDYGQDLMMKQEKFRKEFEKLPFVFDAHSLHLPKGDNYNEEILEEEDPQIVKESEHLGKDLGDIFDIIHNRVKNQIQQEGQVIQYN